jgi:high-affinity Fe2+/Pb2+ permease
VKNPGIIGSKEKETDMGLGIGIIFGIIVAAAIVYGLYRLSKKMKS